MMAFVKILAKPCNLYFFCGSQIMLLILHLSVDGNPNLCLWVAGSPSLGRKKVVGLLQETQGGASGPQSLMEPSAGAVCLVTPSCLTLL